MPFGYACRQRIFKQVPHKPTVRTGPISKESPTPGPTSYEQPQIYCGNGFSKIKRAPAYTFGKVLHPCFTPSVKPNAPMLNLSGTDPRKGVHKIPGGLITGYNWPPGSKLKVPGPGSHDPLLRVKVKRAPAYSLQLGAKPDYVPWDMWTPPPNMYLPPIPQKNPPAYSFSNKRLVLKTFDTPGPGEHEPNYKYVKKKRPEYSLGPKFRPYRGLVTPAPNTYCEKKFMITKPTIPAPSFGIKHTPYLGKQQVYMKPSNIELRVSQY